MYVICEYVAYNIWGFKIGNYSYRSYINEDEVKRLIEKESGYHVSRIEYVGSRPPRLIFGYYL